MDRHSQGALEGVSSEEVRGSGSTGPRGSVQGAVSGGRNDGAADGSTASERPESLGGVGNDAGGVSTTQTGARGNGETRSGGLEDNTQSVDFVITKDFDLGAGGETANFEGNIEAISLFKQLEAERRIATPAEQKVLARYVR